MKQLGTLPADIYTALKRSLETELRVQMTKWNATPLFKRLVESVVDNLARKAAQAVIGVIDNYEVERVCPLCGKEVIP